MATRKHVPQADNEGGIGTALKRWASAFIAAITCTTINALTLAAASVGYTITGGTTSKTLTVDETVAISDKAAKTHGALHLPNASDPIGLPKFSAHKNETDQVGIPDDTWTKITFPTEVYDDGDGYDAPNSKWIPGIIGKARVTAQILWNSSVDQCYLEMDIRINGEEVKSFIGTSSGTTWQSLSLCVDIPITAITDYVEIYARQITASAKNINGGSPYSWFMGHMLP